MALLPEQYNKITRFLDGEMTGEELQAFMEALDTDAALRQQLRFEQMLRLNLAGMEEPAQDEQKARVRKLTVKWLWVGAAAAVITGVLLVIFYSRNQPEQPTIVEDIRLKDTVRPDKGIPKDKQIPGQLQHTKRPALNTDSLFAIYFERDEIPEDPPIFLADALTKYEAGDYSAIIRLDLNNISDMRGEMDKENILALAHYYKGVALLVKGEAELALRELGRAELAGKQKTSRLKTEWYKILANLRLRNYKEAKEEIRQLLVNDKYIAYRKKLKEISTIINKM